MASQLEKRRIRPTTTYRGALEIADLKIPVWGYVKNKRETMPAAKKISSLVEVVGHVATLIIATLFFHNQNSSSCIAIHHPKKKDPREPGSGAVTRDLTYHKVNEDEDEVSKESRIKGYRYGRTIIPWTAEVEETLAYKPEKCLAVICFTNEADVSHEKVERAAPVCLRKPPILPCHLSSCYKKGAHALANG